MFFVRRRDFVRSFIHALSSTRRCREPPPGGSLTVASLPKVGKWSLCAEGSVGREDEGAVSLPQRGKVSGVSLTDEVLIENLIEHLSVSRMKNSFYKFYRHNCARRGVCDKMICTHSPPPDVVGSPPTFCTRNAFRVGIMCGGSL